MKSTTRRFEEENTFSRCAQSHCACQVDKLWTFAIRSCRWRDWSPWSPSEFSRTQGKAETSHGDVAPLKRIGGLWNLLTSICTSKEFVLVDNGEACHACQTGLPSWTKPSVPNVQSDSDTLEPVAESVRDVGPQPLKQDAPLAEPMQQPKYPTPKKIARQELTHILTATRCKTILKGRCREALYRDQRGSMLDSVLPVI